METTRILWSGLTGRVGQAALCQVSTVNNVEIMGGISREHPGYYHYSALSDLSDLPNLRSAVDVVVDFSRPEVFAPVLSLAVALGKPLICGTSHLSNRQMASLYDATNRIPIFRSENFRFKVKTFLDQAVQLAKVGEHFDLEENFYQGKTLPSETSKLLQRKVAAVAAEPVNVHSRATFAADSLICEWEFRSRKQLSEVTTAQRKVYCRTIGLDELGRDVLKIARAMSVQPLRRGEFYDLDAIWGQLSEDA